MECESDASFRWTVLKAGGARRVAHPQGQRLGAVVDGLAQEAVVGEPRRDQDLVQTDIHTVT